MSAHPFQACTHPFAAVALESYAAQLAQQDVESEAASRDSLSDVEGGKLLKMERFVKQSALEQNVENCRKASFVANSPERESICASEI